jgi:hypothetical protein
MVNKTALGVLAVLAIGQAQAFPQAVKYGVGIVLFEPSGLSAKAWLGRSGAVAAAIGWSVEEGHYLQLQADYLFFDQRLARDRNLSLHLYLGAGGQFIFRDEDGAWLRFPLGLDFLLQKSPLDFFFELAPSFNFSNLRISGAVGFRYIFVR